MRFTLSLALALACCRQPFATASEPVRDAGAPPAPAATAESADNSPAIADAAVADAGAESAPTPAPAVVLHVGDSMVGGYGGLSKALEARFKPLGSKFVRDWTVSVSINTFDHERHFVELLRQHKPDVVVLTLGANDVFVPYPKSIAVNVESIARKASGSGRRCYWITPPTWKPDTGITAIIKESATGCHVFDSSQLKLSRAGDGIHPTDRGGVEWVDKFWPFYEAGQRAQGPSAALTLDAGL